MTGVTDRAAEGPVGGLRRAAGVGALVGGFAALVVALFLSTAPARAEGLPVWVRVATGVLVLVGVGAVVRPLWLERRGSAWTGGRVAFGLGAIGSAEVVGLA
ncbi:MAG TPA: hypothetical protein VGX25_27785 [Actinophytocola sp.]|uniref:hypothetical protein n=1 Tax=Actinophytocola sp. TaxID=1872138 RepID=UPI002DDCDF0E|nr:hypothetical protein [Actinophytocola sp.]HEV2783202.1 hypothetical protein [Actinophytocola sp.]